MLIAAINREYMKPLFVSFYLAVPHVNFAVCPV